MDEDKVSNNKNKNNKSNDPHQKPITKTKEIGGPKGPEPTRYGDWEKKGRCIDF